MKSLSVFIHIIYHSLNHLVLFVWVDHPFIIVSCFSVRIRMWRQWRYINLMPLWMLNNALMLFYVSITLYNCLFDVTIKGINTRANKISVHRWNGHYFKCISAKKMSWSVSKVSGFRFGWIVNRMSWDNSSIALHCWCTTLTLR